MGPAPGPARPAGRRRGGAAFGRGAESRGSGGGRQLRRVARVAALAGGLWLLCWAAAVVRRRGVAGGADGVRWGGDRPWRPADLGSPELLGASHPLAAGGCAVDRIDARALGGAGGFARAFEGMRPVVATGLGPNAAFARATERVALARLKGTDVVLRASDTYSQGSHTANFGDYLAGIAGARTTSGEGSDARDALYLFGPVGEIGEAFAGVLEEYRPPPLSSPGAAQSLSVGPSGSGVPFHVHGDGWCEVAHGRKLWLLAPPWAKPDFDPVQPALDWVRSRYTAAHAASRGELLACVIGPGEALYFPPDWWHLVLNVGEVVAVSSFNPAPPPGEAHGGAEAGARPFGGQPFLAPELK